MISIQRPQIILAVFLLIPAIFFINFHFKKLSRVVSGFYEKEPKSKTFKNLKKRLFLRTFFRSLSWICAILAFAGISWGNKKISVQKNGSTVCFVFDISWSMMAADCPGKLTRLDAAKLYAANLVALLPGSSFSAVLSKGDGFTAIPETEDTSAILSLISNLNPNLVSTPGSSIGKGILSALRALSLNSAKLNYIFVFTDGDETDNSLQNALEEAGKNGIPVTMIGFGSENETEILTGDRKTKAKTALRAEKMKKLAESAGKRFFSSKKNSENGLIHYVSAAQNGSANFLINQIKTRGTMENPENQENGEIFTYETVSVKRHSLFIFLALIFLMLSFIAEELTFLNFPKKKSKSKVKKTASAISAVFCLAFLTSCGANSKNQKEILKGSWNFYQENYRTAMAQFLDETIKTKDDSMAHQYALFGLAATYLAVDEYDAALNRTSQILTGTAAVPKELESAAFYNAGIIFARKNDFMTASEYFKKAILSDPNYLDAKINLELCSRHLEEQKAAQAESEMQKVSESKENSSQMQNEIFNIIRENENKQWKKMESQPEENGILDY